jgi:tetrahydromethanopterin S-methyltransferase subunit G
MELDVVEKRLAVTEAQIAALHDRLERLETKLDMLIECETERKAGDRVIEKYAKIAFWAVISIGGLINWDKIIHVFDAALPR